MNKLRSLTEHAQQIRQSNPEKAIELFQDILRASDTVTNDEYKTKALFNIAISYLILGNYNESLKNFNDSFNTPYADNNKHLQSEILRGIGSNYFRTYNYKEALRYYHLSENASIESGNIENLHRVYQGFGSLYSRLKLDEKSLSYSVKSLEVAKQVGTNGTLQESLMSIGACHYILGNLDKAVEYLNRSLKYSANRFAEANALYFLSMMNFEEGNIPEAAKLALRQIEISEKNNYHDFNALGNRLLGDIKFKESAYNEALEFYEKASEILDKLGEKQINFTILKRKIDTYEKTGDLEKVSSLYKELYTNHIEYMEKNIQLKIGQIDVEYETEKIRNEIDREREINQKLLKALQEVNGLNRELEKLHEEKDSLMNIVAHDLRNPIQSILSSAKMIHSDKDGSDLVDELVTNIKGQSKRMVSLINSLLEHRVIESGIIKLNITEFDINSIFSQLVKNNNAQAISKDIIIHNDNLLNFDIIRTDFDLLYQAFENLLTNSIKFSPKGSNIHLSYKNTGNSFVFGFEDEGPGFTDDDKRKLYTSFARLSAIPTANEHSTGLGLSIVKRLCELLGADIQLESEVNKGSKFVITIKGE